MLPRKTRGRCRKKTKAQLNILCLYPDSLYMSQNQGSIKICFKEVIFFKFDICPLRNKEDIIFCFSVTFGILSTLKFSNSQMQC